MRSSVFNKKEAEAKFKKISEAYDAKIGSGETSFAGGSLAGYDEYVPMVDKAVDATWKVKPTTINKVQSKAKEFKEDLTPRKLSIKRMIQGELTKLAEEAEEEKIEEEKEEDAEKEKAGGPAGGEEVKAGGSTGSEKVEA